MLGYSSHQPALRLTCRLCSPGSCNTCRHVGQLLALRLRWCRQLPALPRLEPSAPTSASVNQRWRQQLNSSRPKSPTSRWTGRPQMPARSAMRCMRPIRCSRSAFQARNRIPPSSSNRRRWLPSRHQSHPIVRICRPTLSPMASSRTPSSRASSMPERRIPSFLPAPGRSMRPLTSCQQHATTRRTLFAFVAAGFWATAPARARGGRSPALCSTTG